jgi:hypothetical protein
MVYLAFHDTFLYQYPSDVISAPLSGTHPGIPPSIPILCENMKSWWFKVRWGRGLVSPPPHLRSGRYEVTSHALQGGTLTRRWLNLIILPF